MKDTLFDGLCANQVILDISVWVKELASSGLVFPIVMFAVDVV